MKKLFLVLIIMIVGALFVPTVSGKVLEDSGSNYATYSLQPEIISTRTSISQFEIYRIQEWNGLYFLYLKTDFVSNPEVLAANPYYNMVVTFRIGADVVGRGTAQYNALYNSAGGIIGVQLWLDIDEWHPTGYVGTQKVKIIPASGTLFNGVTLATAKHSTISSDRPIGFSMSSDSSPWLIRGLHIARSHYYWQNDINIGDEFVSLTRQLDGTTYASTIQITSDAGYIEDTSSNNINLPYIGTGNWTVINPYGRIYTGTLVSGPDDPTDPDGSGITVYIKNSQTGALIANANVVIDALVDGEYYPVTNRTEPSGIFTITLQPTGGGPPNPDGYRLIVTADGYNNPMPEINFTLGDYIKYFECFLDPIAGGPADENKTFIDFFVRDMSSNPISGATVKFGKYTLITNSAGYTVFEVDKNNNYSWTVSKSGYGALTGNAVIGDDPRHTINTVLAPIVTPTSTTPIPTSPPIGPTPTMTAPTGEHVSNLLEWFAAHFGMILGGGVEIGKIFMWLCFTVPVGVYVGKEAKAGAAGFMAGAGIVTLFFVLIGWVPIWLVVLLALVIGLLYTKVFNTPDNGGGR